MSIKANIEEIINKKELAAKSAGKSGEDVLLIAVTKLHPPVEINEAIDCGVTDIGENKVQEILNKYDDVKPVNWHLIGHLQRNKVKYIIDKVKMIHSVDSLRLAEEIDKRAKQNDRVMDILIQVNTARDDAKFGIDKEELEPMLSEISERFNNLRVCGLMCIAPFAENPDEIRPYFKEAKELFDKFSNVDMKNIDFRYLSMGMSHDYETAIEEGSNVVRVGTAIFGERDYRSEEK